MSILSRYCKRMPAHESYRSVGTKTLTHIYNCGIEKRVIFEDSADYDVFLSYLEEYLLPPKDLKDKKLMVTIGGRSFKGTPHQPNNFADQIELIAFDLSPNHFHLVLNQKVANAIGRFIKSLCTRYAVYYNKRHKHKGQLFNSPYKARSINDPLQLLNLTRHLHKTHQGATIGINYSSYDYYLGIRNASWIKPGLALSYFENVNKDTLGGFNRYQDFVEKYNPSPQEKTQLAEITIDEHVPLLERIEEVTSLKNKGAMSEENTKQVKITASPYPSKARWPEISVAFLVFLALTSIGLINIKTNGSLNRANQKIQAAPKVAGITTISDDAPPQSAIGVQPEMMVVVRKTSPKEKVIIFQNATSASEQIRDANDGETFMLLSVKDEWFEVELADGSTGFIFDAQAYLKEKE